MGNKVVGSAVVANVDMWMAAYARLHSMDYSEYMFGGDVWRTIFVATSSLDYTLAFNVDRREFTLRWVVSDSEGTPWAYGCEVFGNADGLSDRLEELAVDVRSGEFVDGGAPVFDDFDGVPSLDDVMRLLSMWRATRPKTGRLHVVG